MLNGVKSAERVVDIFETVATVPRGLGMSELSRRLGIPRSSTWNLVATLRRRGYLEQNADGHIVLGARLFDVGVCARADIRLRTVGRPVLAALVKRTRETAFLGILTPDFTILHLDKVVSPQVIRYDAELGEKRPAHCTAMGKALLAELPPALLKTYFTGRKLERFTPATVTSAEALTRELDRVRAAGFAMSVDERVPGASAIGAAVRAVSGRALASVIVAGPTARIVAGRQALSAHVKDAAERISRALRGETAAAARALAGASTEGGAGDGDVPSSRRRRAPDEALR
jgi:IclR family transcriptional regulator, KDG regulon repressor